MVGTNGRNFDLLTLEQVLLRLSPPGDERLSGGDTLVKQVGGAELDMAAGAALLGLHTSTIPKFSTHDIGSFMEGKIRSFGVSDDFFVYDQSPTARIGIYYHKNGAYSRKPRVIYNHNHGSFLSLDIDEIPEEVYMAFKCPHTTGIILVLSGDMRETTIETIKRFKVVDILVPSDVNFRGDLQIGNQARECTLEILPYVDVFFCSEDTARLTFLKTGTARGMMKSSTEEFSISIVVSTQRIVHGLKRHTFGSVMYDTAEDEYYEEGPYQDTEVVDRIGSGDAYISGALYRLLSTGGDCAGAVAFGNTTIAIKNIIPGNLPSSSLEEIQTIIRVHGQAGPQSEMVR